MPIARILLVDSAPEVRATLAQAFPELEAAGGIVTAGRASVARQADLFRPDLVLVDIGPSCRAPIELVADLRASGPKNPIPVVLLSPVADSVTLVHACAASGAVLRSLTPEALARAVRLTFAEARLSGQLARLEDLGGAAFVSEMIDLFLEGTPPRLQAARAGLAAGNLEAVERATHSLKSSAGNVGADRVQELAGEIEQQADAGQAEKLPALMQELEEALAWVEARFFQEKLARAPRPRPS